MHGKRDFRVMLAGEAIIGTNVADGDLMWNYLSATFEIDKLSNAEIKEELTKNLDL